MKKQSVNPTFAQPIADLYRLSQAMRVGDMIWVSGQVGVDATLAPAKGIEAQTRLAFQNVQAMLEAAGATMADIVDLTVYMTDVAGGTETFLRIKDEFIPAPYPAVTGVGVASLTLPELMIEIRAVAVAGSGRS